MKGYAFAGVLKMTRNVIMKVKVSFPELIKKAIKKPELESKRQVVSIYHDGRLNTKQASLYVGLSVKTMAMMRSQGTGAKFIKRGRIFYYQTDLDDWLNRGGRVNSTAQSRFNELKQ